MREVVLKLCFLCGKNGHIQGPECPLCCVICGGEIENGICVEFRCAQTDASPKTETTAKNQR